jgi:hypothetical protein
VQRRVVLSVCGEAWDHEATIPVVCAMADQALGWLARTSGHSGAN